jgi:hypothetical protein
MFPKLGLTTNLSLLSSIPGRILSRRPNKGAIPETSFLLRNCPGSRAFVFEFILHEIALCYPRISEIEL